MSVVLLRQLLDLILIGCFKGPVGFNHASNDTLLCYERI